MLKHEEHVEPGSCWNKAKDSERLFILLGRDKAAPVTIRAWVEERIALGLNTRDDEQIQEALACAEKMQAEQG